jgi:hypothetical protein
MQALLQNLRFSLRLLGRNPGLAITVLLTVALGIGANTAIFTVDYATLLAPLPFPQPNQLVMVWSKIQDNRNVVAAGDFTDWKQQNTVFSDLNAFSGTSFNIATKDQPQFLQASLTTPGLLQMQGEPLFLGRYFLPEEGQAGHEHVVILTHKLWLKLGADRKIIGTTLRLDVEPLGIRTDHVLTFSLPVPDSRSKDLVQIAAYYRNILAHIDAVPGVSHATVTTGYPLHGVGFGMPFTLAGGPAYSDLSQRPGAGFGMVTPDYVSTYGLHLVNGRSFSEQDTANSVKVVMVNQSFAKKYLQGKDPLRQRVVVEQLIPGVQKLGPPVEWQIVGVYQDVHAADWHERLEEMVIPFWQIPWPQATIGVRTAEDPATMQASMAAAVHAVDPQIALAEPKTLDQIRDESLSDERFTLILFASFAVVALFLATLGIYGVVAFSVAQRSHEIAIRMAPGATRNRVLALVVRESTVLAAIGLGLGLIGAYFVGRAMQSMLFDVRALDFSAFTAVALILLASALLACYLPARRAASVEPMRVLRTE